MKKSQKAKSLQNQNRWKINMKEKLGLSQDNNKTAHKEINHAVHPCFCKGKSSIDKWNKFRNKKEQVFVDKRSCNSCDSLNADHP